MIYFTLTEEQEMFRKAAREFAETQKAAKMAVDIHGGYGCMEEYAVSRYYRD